jgi:hypothetical protein
MRTFTNKENAELLSTKLINWYGADSITTHFENHSEILVNGLKFVISESNQTDKYNGTFKLTHTNQPIECTKMYIMVREEQMR